MQNTNRIYDVDIRSKKSREDYMSICGGEQLNNHLNVMEKLACQKGGWVVEAYGEDLEYVLSMDMNRNPTSTKMLVGGNRNSLGSPNSKYKYVDDVFRSLLDKNDNAYCSFATDKTKLWDGRCENRIRELVQIKNNLEVVVEGGKTIDRRTYRDIRNFIDIIICCSEQISNDDTAQQTLIDPTIKYITGDQVLTEIAYQYSKYILQNEKKKYIKEFKNITDRMIELGRLGLESSEEYKELDSRQNNLLSKYGPSVALTTSYIYWIYDQYETNIK